MWRSSAALLDMVKEMGSKSLTLYSLCTLCVNKIPLRYPGGRYSLWWPIRGGTARKGYPFQASRIWKCRDFTSWSMWIGREIYHLSLWKGPKGLTNKFYGFIKSRKPSIFVTDSHLKDDAFTAVKRDIKFYTRYVKGEPFVNKRYTKGVPFSWKMVYKG